MFLKIPLTALRVFESSARLGTFAAAAEELAVTPAAVSHQIKSLEAWLGAMLFKRGPNGVRLTDEGWQLYRECHEALLKLSRALDASRPVAEEQKLVLTTTPAFAATWLIPRLARFQNRDPRIHIKVETSNTVLDLDRDASVDLAIRCSLRDYPKLYQVGMFDEYFGAYAAPGYDSHLSNGPLDLIAVQWATPSPVSVEWETWCAAAGKMDWLDRAVFRLYDDEHYALQAVLHGQGIALASSVIVAEYVAAGTLVRVDQSVRLPGARYLALCRPGRERSVAVRTFLEWLSDEAARTREVIQRIDGK